MKKLLKNRSKLLLVITILESILSIWFLCYFNYLDRLNYAESVTTTTKDLALLIQNMYTSTWWALIILVSCFIAIFALISFIYKESKYQLISCILWFILLLLALNVKDSFMSNISIICIFIPIMAANIIAFLNQRKMTLKNN